MEWDLDERCKARRGRNENVEPILDKSARASFLLFLHFQLFLSAYAALANNSWLKKGDVETETRKNLLLVDQGNT